MDNEVEFTNEMLATICRDETIRHEHMGVNEPNHNGVVARRLGLAQSGGMAACLNALRLFPWQIPNLDRFWVKAAIYLKDCLITTATTANAGYKPPYESQFGTLPPANTLAFMQIGFRCIQRANKSEAKTGKCFYLNGERNHMRDSVQVLTSSGLLSDTQDVTLGMERVPIITAGLNTGTAAAPEAWDADWHVRYPPPVSQVPPVMPVTPAMATVPSVMTPVMKPAPPTMVPPPGVMSPSSPSRAEKPQIHEGPPDNGLFQPAVTLVRRSVYHKATSAAGPPFTTNATPTAPLPCKPAMRASVRRP